MATERVDHVGEVPWSRMANLYHSIAAEAASDDRSRPVPSIDGDGGEFQAQSGALVSPQEVAGQEGPGRRAGRAIEGRRRLAVLRDAAPLEKDDFVGEAARLAEVVGGHDDLRAGGMERVDDLLDRPRRR